MCAFVRRELSEKEVAVLYTTNNYETILKQDTNFGFEHTQKSPYVRIGVPTNTTIAGHNAYDIMQLYCKEKGLQLVGHFPESSINNQGYEVFVWIKPLSTRISFINSFL